VVGEDQEGGAEDPQASVKGHAVQDRAHAVLPDPEMEVPAAVLAALHRLVPVEVGLGGGGQVGGAPTRQGSSRARAWSTWPPAFRVATALPPGSYRGRRAARSGGSSWRKASSHAWRRSG